MKAYSAEDKAVRIFEKLDDDQAKGLAIMINGMNAVKWTPNQSKVSLRAYIKKNPRKFIDIVDSTDYEVNYLVATALDNKIVSYSALKKALVWSDDQGVLLEIPRGTSSLKTLSEFLKTKSEESELILRELSVRIKG